MKKTRLLIVGVAVTAAFAILILADQNSRGRLQVAPTNTATVGAGHWVADTGDVIWLRHDGTGTSIHKTEGKPHHCEFDWSCDGSLLTIENFPNVLGSFMAHETGLATATFAVDEISEDRLVFRHDGITVALTPYAGIDRPSQTIHNGG